jgi:hypothetical protein
MALVTALVALMLITVVGLALTSAGMMAVTVATNERENTEALAVADAGMTHAKALLLNQVWITPWHTGYSPLLTLGANATACTGDEFSVVPSFASSPYPPQAELIPAAVPPPGVGGRTYPAGNTFGGRYEVRLCDDHAVEQTQLATAEYCVSPPVGAAVNPCLDANQDGNRQVLARSRGVGRNGAEVTLEALFQDRPLPAVISNGDLTLGGHAHISGQVGAVHSNEDVSIIGGDVCVEKYYSATGAISGSADGGISCTSGGAPQEPGSDEIPVPKLDPLHYREVADFLLLGNTVYCGAANIHAFCAGASHTNLIPWTVDLAATPPRKATGWDYQANCNGKGSCWRLGVGVTKADILSATYYTDTSFQIAGSPGSPGNPSATPPVPPDPVFMTLFAQRWVDIAGNPTLSPKLTGPAYAIVAGMDIEMSGTVNENAYSGLYYARQQVKFTGDAAIDGLFVAGNYGDDDPNLVSLASQGGASMVINGSSTITNSTFNDWRALRMVSWRECRGADPSNPCGNP